MDTVPTTIGEQFALLFDSGDEFVLLKKEALSGRLKQYEFVHFVSWQVLLGVLPTEQEEGSGVKAIDRWEASIKKSREEYARLKAELLVNPHASDDSDVADDATIDNPLSTGESSTWAQYFAIDELKKDIFRDVDRTYPEIDFFRETAIQDMLTMILLVYAKQHPQLSYKQGMHEILALPLYVVHRERVEKLAADHYTPDSDKHNFSSLIRTLYDPAFLEHDLFSLFSKILDQLGPFYIQSRHSAQNSDSSSSASTASNGASDDTNSSTQSQGSAVLRKCRLIQDVLLKKHDELLSTHLADIELEPQLYLLRWIRILFGREFHLEDTITVWDAVFAFDDRFGFIDHMAVAMLMFIRTQLLSRDFADCIKRLQKYPPVEDVTILVEHAIALTKPKPAGLVGPLPFPPHVQPHSTTPPAAPSAGLVTVASKTHSSTTSTQKASGNSGHGAHTTQKPIVYASPAYNAQVSQSNSKHSSTPSHHASALGGGAPKRSAPNASDAQILKATPLNTPPSAAPHARTSNTSQSHHSKGLNETPMVTIPKQQWEELNRLVADSNSARSKFTDKLNTVIGSLQTVLTSPTELSPQEVTELLVMTVAGLKKTRDVANGLIADDDDDTGTPLASMQEMAQQKATPSKRLAAAPSSPAPVPHSYSTNGSTSIPASVDFGLLPPSDTDEWVFTPAAVTGKPSAPTYSAPAASKPTGPPTAIDIPASSEASKAVVSSIFD